jgi:hypothetical protein
MSPLLPHWTGGREPGVARCDDTHATGPTPVAALARRIAATGCRDTTSRDAMSARRLA